MGLLFKTFLLGGLLLWGIQSRAVEVLGHINEDSQSPPQSQTPPANNDRSITYRVICTPGGEVLPDCEQPVNDQEDSPLTPAIATPDMPLGAEDLVEEAGNEKQLAVEPAAVTSPRTSAKPVKQKANSKKKASAKKTETQKKPAKATTSKKASKQQVSSKSTSKKTKNK